MNKETLRMQMLAGIITESQYKTKLNEENTFIDAATMKKGGDGGIDLDQLKPGTIIAKNKTYLSKEELRDDAGEFIGIKDGEIVWKQKDGKEVSWKYPEDLVLVKNLPW